MKKKEIELLQATAMAKALYSVFLSHVEGEMAICYKDEVVFERKNDKKQ